MYHYTKMAANYTKDNTSAGYTVAEHLLWLEVHTNIPTAVQIISSFQHGRCYDFITHKMIHHPLRMCNLLVYCLIEPHSHTPRLTYSPIQMFRHIPVSYPHKLCYPIYILKLQLLISVFKKIIKMCIIF